MCMDGCVSKQHVDVIKIDSFLFNAIMMVNKADTTRFEQTFHAMVLGVLCNKTIMYA